MKSRKFLFYFVLACEWPGCHAVEIQPRKPRSARLHGFGVAAVARILIIERFRGGGSSKSHCRNQVREHAKTTGGR